MCAVCGCSSDLLLAKWACRQSNTSDAGSDAGWRQFQFPWSTGFETDFCEYLESNGACYDPNDASRSIVEAPVHSGHYAAAFSVIGDASRDPESIQARCHRNGELPREAYYGAWYYVPALARNLATWNLFHFQGGDSPAFSDLEDFWDVSLVNNDAGDLRLTVFNFKGGSPDSSAAPAIPIGSWFHIEFYLKRAADETGAVALYQNGTLIAQATNIRTGDTPYGQWYVGNYATGLDPVESTVYVDDVTIRSER